MKKSKRFKLGRILLLSSFLAISLGVLISYFGVFDKKDWFPFPSNLWGQYYSAGPISITQNLADQAENSQEFSQLNRYVSRLSYFMTRGTAHTDIAILNPRPHWPDRFSMNLFGLELNADELQVSSVFSRSGFQYDWVSRENLLNSDVIGNQLWIDHARFNSLILLSSEKMDLEQVEKLKAISEKGIPIFYLGNDPTRALGFENDQSRDLQVRNEFALLKPHLGIVKNEENLLDRVYRETRKPIVEPVTFLPSSFRITIRETPQYDVVLFFNDTNEKHTFDFRLNRTYSRLKLFDPRESFLPPPLDAQNSVPISLGAHRVLVLVAQKKETQTSADTKNLELDWNDCIAPTREYAPYVRWWWPGGDVESKELNRELELFQRLGLGGVEIQPLTLGLKKDDLIRRESSIYTVGTKSYFERVAFVLETAKNLGLKCDLTLGSGWPMGHPRLTRSREQQLFFSNAAFQSGDGYTVSIPPPVLPDHVQMNNTIIPGVVGSQDTKARLVSLCAISPQKIADLDSIFDLMPFRSGRLRLPAFLNSQWTVVATYQNETAHNVVGSAFPGSLQASFVLDHLSSNGVNDFIEIFGKPLLENLPKQEIHSLFVDSFELVGELPWTDDFSQVFFEQHHYRIEPFLPLVFKEKGESKYLETFRKDQLVYSNSIFAQRIREDYESTREFLFRDRFLKTLKAWTSENNIPLKLQAHGGFADILDAYQLSDIPESEGLYSRGSFDFLKLASSAAHVTGKPIASSESLIRLSIFGNNLTLEEEYALAGNAFSAGINRLIYHGFPYRYERK